MPWFRPRFGEYGSVQRQCESILHRAAAPRRVALGFAQRMASPAVTLMHNSSSFHALPALLSDLHGALASIGNGTEPRAGAVSAVPPSHVATLDSTNRLNSHGHNATRNRLGP